MALGRGLGELLGEVETAYNNSMNNESQSFTDQEISIKEISPNPYQPRKDFDQEKLKELSLSIKQHGLIQPIAVVKNSVDNTYILVAGERRLKAAKLIKQKTIKATILSIDSTKMRELALIENIQRDDLNIIEIANSYDGLIKEHNFTHQQLAKTVSKSRSLVTNTLRLLTLSENSKSLLQKEIISAGHGKLLISFNENEQKTITNLIIKEKMSVREAEKIIQDIKIDNLSIEDIADEKNEKNNEKVIPTLNLKQLDTVLSRLNDNKISAIIGKDYLKLKINSQEDIKKILSFFN